jgi:hypothetical protein
VVESRTTRCTKAKEVHKLRDKSYLQLVCIGQQGRIEQIDHTIHGAKNVNKIGSLSAPARKRRKSYVARCTMTSYASHARLRDIR